MTPNHPLRPPQRLGRGLIFLCLFGMVILLGFTLLFGSRKTEITYSGKPPGVWFYGGRTNFFQESTRHAAQEAIGALGTNAFPFLISNLQGTRGSGNPYFRFYRVLPRWIQSRLQYPILDDDIKAISLSHIRSMSNVPLPQIQTLADCVSGFDNPRLRMMAFTLIRSKHQDHPIFLNLCRKLLNDEHSGLRLEAAISLAESSVVSNSCGPLLLPILLAAIDSKEEREACLTITSYSYQQQPPGGVGPLNSRTLSRFGPGRDSLDETLRRRVVNATNRLERYLNQEQKKPFP